MNILVIVSHPDKESLNQAITKTVLTTLCNNGYNTMFHDLYAEDFPPLLYSEEIPEGASLPPIIASHCSDISNADGIVIVHPTWWGQPPAILKGWIDRVIRPGIAYKFIESDKGEGIPVGLLKAKMALVFNTSNTVQDREKKEFGDPLETIWKNCVFGLCGVKTFYRKTFGVVITSSLDQRTQWLKEAESITNQCFPQI
jgi:NAD(P)H dehydrogenase (quinone)